MPKQPPARLRKMMLIVLTLIVALVPSMTPAFAAAADKSGDDDSRTAMPIKHVIVIVGENRSYDHLFATYVPQKW